MPILYRSMQQSRDGFPMLGSSARALGVRVAIDIESKNGYVGPGIGGMSVTPDDPLRLPRFRRPPDLGGTGRDPAFGIDTIDLPSDLVYRPDPLDPNNHGFIEPAMPMSFEQFLEAIARTRESWKRHTTWRL